MVNPSKLIPVITFYTWLLLAVNYCISIMSDSPYAPPIMLLSQPALIICESNLSIEEDEVA